MLKKILMILLLVCPFVINGCSCDKFDLDTYNSAVKHYNNSTGLDYKLTITTNIEGNNSYWLEEIWNKYELSTTRVVENFSSSMKRYQVMTDSQTGNSAPQKIFELNRYYRGEENKFYTNEISNGVNNKRVEENITYEEKYSEDSEYNIKNLVPLYESKFISNFNIVKDENKDGSSIATFLAACPMFLECENDTIEYKVYINKNYYVSKIEYTVTSTVQKVQDNEPQDFIKTVTYKYEFNKYNSKVVINFPSDLVNY